MLISNECNNFFVTVVKNITKGLSNVNSELQNFLKNKLRKFFLNETITGEIQKTNQSLHNKMVNR